MIAGSPTIEPGDTCKVLTTGISYLCVAPEQFEPLGGACPTQKRFSGWSTDFRDAVGIAVSDTATSANIAGSGVVVCGQGLAETDAGVTVAYGAGGPVASLLTTDEAAHVCGLTAGGATEAWAPATYGPISVEAKVAMETALTDRAFFIGFIGAYTAALDPVVTGSATTLTLVQDDVCGLFFDSGNTAATRLFAPHNKADEAASIATTATGVDTGSDFPAAGTYVTLRVTIDQAGKMTCFANDVQIAEIPLAASTTVALNPIVYVESNAAAIKTMLVKHFAAWSEG
jgi:hypothetical protein